MNCEEHNTFMIKFANDVFNYSLISGNANGSIAIHDVQTSNKDNDCALVTSVTGRLVPVIVS